jgi:hypothetical protein
VTQIAEVAAQLLRATTAANELLLPATTAANVSDAALLEASLVELICTGALTKVRLAARATRCFCEKMTFVKCRLGRNLSSRVN